MVPTGAPAALPRGDQPAKLTDPRGKTYDVPAGVSSFAGTFTAGFYSVTSGQAKAEFAANLLSPRESDIAPRSLTTPAGANVAEQHQVVRTNQPLWPILALAALAVLMVEWYCYHRRVG